MTETTGSDVVDEDAINRLVGYVGAGNLDAVRSFVGECVEEATALVARRVGVDTVPDVIRRRAVLEVGADLYHRRRVRNGVASFDGVDMQPIRVTRDPMKAAEDILAPFLAPGLA